MILIMSMSWFRDLIPHVAVIQQEEFWLQFQLYFPRERELRRDICSLTFDRLYPSPLHDTGDNSHLFTKWECCSSLFQSHSKLWKWKKIFGGQLVLSAIFPVFPSENFNSVCNYPYLSFLSFCFVLENCWHGIQTILESSVKITSLIHSLFLCFI